MLALFLLVACQGRPQVVVVGGGPAGMAAAIEASSGARVVLLEGEPVLGGVARLSQGVTALPSESDLRAWDQAAGGSNPMRARYVREVHPEVVDWLEALGVGWKPMDNRHDGIPLLGVVGGGAALVQAMEAELRSRGVVVRTGVRATELHPGEEWTVDLSDGSSLQAGAVVLATGGFAAQLDRIRERLNFGPEIPLLSGSPGYSDGNGHELVLRLGGQERQATQVVLYAHGVPDRQGHTHMLVGAEGAWTVDSHGVRLDGVDSPRGDSGRALVERGGRGWAIFDHDSVQRALLWSLDRASLVSAEGMARTWGYVAQRPEALDALMELPPGTAARGMTEGPLRGVPPWLALPLRPVTAKVLTGVETDPQGRVLSTAGTPILGLYASGELSGFGHPFDGLVMDSTMVALAVLTGRDAGRAAIGDL